MNLSNNSQRMIVVAIALVAIASLVMVAFSSAIFTPAEAAKYSQSNRGVFVQSQTQSQTSTTGGGGGGGGDGPDH
jgi:hypothetical protein